MRLDRLLPLPASTACAALLAWLLLPAVGPRDAAWLVPLTAGVSAGVATWLARRDQAKPAGTAVDHGGTAVERLQ